MLLWHLQDPLVCELVAYFLHYSLELMAIASYWYFVHCGSLLRRPVEVTQVMTKISIVALDEVLIEHIPVVSVRGVKECSCLWFCQSKLD